MSNKSAGIILAALILVASGFAVRWLMEKPVNNHEAQATTSKVAVVNVDAVVNDPEKFSGLIGVEGSVTEVDSVRSTFALGCEDACVVMPVQYRGRMPKEGTDVIAYGEVTKTEEAKYVFVAQELATK